MKVFKRKRTRRGKIVESKTFYGRIKNKIINLGVTHKDLAERKLFKLMNDEALYGVLPSKVFKDAQNTVLPELLEAHLENLKATGRTRKYQTVVKTRCSSLFNECGWKYLQDITADSFLKWRAKQSFKAKTLNHYLGTINSFLNSLVSAEKLPRNPLARIEKARVLNTRKRRAFTDDELKRLFALESHRRLVYQLAAYTGLRRQELRALQWGDFVVDEGNDAAWLKLRGDTTKNREAVTIPIRSELRLALLEKRPKPFDASGSILGRTIPDMPRYCKDLALAGIPYADDQGKFADFHAFRVTFATNLLKSGVDPRTVQYLMRHKDIKQTLVTYTDKGQMPIYDSAMKLPWLGQEIVQTSGTGKGTEKEVHSGQNLSDVGKSESDEDDDDFPDSPSRRREISSPVMNCRKGVRADREGFELDIPRLII